MTVQPVLDIAVAVKVVFALFDSSEEGRRIFGINADTVIVLLGLHLAAVYCNSSLQEPCGYEGCLLLRGGN